MDIQNKVALITGGASGMGYATAVYLRQKGMKVMIWDVNIPATCDLPYALTCDVTQEKAVEEALLQTLNQVGTPSLLVNCAGIAPAKRMVTKEGAQPLADFKKGHRH